MNAHVQVKSPKLIAFVLMFGAFVGLFGETALNMALTEVMEDFEISPSTAQWLTTGYLLVLAVLVPLSSYLVRWFTTRQLIISALCFSLIGSLLGAIAPAFPVLLIGRMVQALGTGIFLPLMFSVVLMIFPIHKRGAVMGIVGLVLTTGPALGPTIAGLIISSSSWHYIFWIMIVLYAVVFLIGASKVENTSTITKPSIDLVSLLLSTIAFGGIVYALATMAEISFSDPQVWLPLVVGIIALLLFIIRQLKMAEPMINLQAFKYPMFSLGVVMMFATMFMILSVAILTPLYLKSVLAYTAIGAGLLMLPGNVLNIIMAPIVGTNFDKVGATIFTRIGFSLITIASILFLATISSTTPVWQIVAILCVFFLGVSMAIMPSQTNAMNALPAKLYADGSAALNTLTQVAGAAGTAVAITVFTSAQNRYIAEHGPNEPHKFLAYGVNHAMIPVLIVAIVGLICSLFIQNSRSAH
ncbi:DHA2 family efflux MFS transporter permease subunit [Paenibacillus xylaniclasticus]|uniref:DHA2 family efflux MFS transporter permease subunit n=1 Tax=Paenibacillus xylaniclasticus TaxID=588083 RepID=UPI000FD7AB47|nr:MULTISPECIES: DHA2 family efflux MFS transporter permease subunit [Paenibacillus]GFN32945.1 lincomycin resistance protein LmrB [Paenibacillus curdlanolyticus]